MKTLRSIAIVLMLFVMTVAMSIAQTNTANFTAYEGRGGVSVLFTSLNGNTDTDSTTFVDWTPISGSTVQFWAQTYDSINQATADTVVVYVLGSDNQNSPMLFMDTLTIIGNNAISSNWCGNLTISSTITAPYIGFRAVTTATVAKANRKLVLKLNAPYITGVNASDIRSRVYDGKYGAGR